MSYSPVPAAFHARLWNKIYAHPCFDVTMQMLDEIEWGWRAGGDEPEWPLYQMQA